MITTSVELLPEKISVPRVHQPQPDLPADGRNDVAVAQLHLVVGHRALICLDRPFVLLDGLLLIVQLLLGNCVSRVSGLVSLQIHSRLRQHALIVLQVPFRLRQRSLIGLRIDVHQRIAFLNDLTLGVMNLPSPYR